MKKKDAQMPSIQSVTDAFELTLNKRDGMHVLRLYIAGFTPKSQRAVENVKKICEEHLKGRYELEVIDIYQQPILAKEGQIVAAPTLVKELPPPLRRFVGDMSQTEKILRGLGLQTKTREPTDDK